MIALACYVLKFSSVGVLPQERGPNPGAPVYGARCPRTQHLFINSKNNTSENRHRKRNYEK